MNEGLIPRRYAKALLEFADTGKPGTATALYGVMKQLDGSFAANPGLQKALANQFVSEVDKTALLTSAAGLAKDDEGDGAKAYASWLRLMARNGRLNLVRQTALAYIDLYRKQMNIRPVHVTTATAMDAAQEERLKDLIAKHLKGATMEYSSSVDPALIGGFTIEAGNERLDASVADELRQLRLALLNK